MPHGRRRILGFTDLGGPFLPPQPPGVVMTDRSTGTLYYLTETAGGVNPALVVTTPVPAQWNTTAFGPNDGPVLDTVDGQIRLFISGGTLDYEEVAVTSSKVENHSVDTRRSGFTKTVYRLTPPGGGRIRLEAGLGAEDVLLLEGTEGDFLSKERFTQGDAVSTFTLEEVT